MEHAIMKHSEQMAWYHAIVLPIVVFVVASLLWRRSVRKEASIIPLHQVIKIMELVGTHGYDPDRLNTIFATSFAGTPVKSACCGVYPRLPTHEGSCDAYSHVEQSAFKDPWQLAAYLCKNEVSIEIARTILKLYQSQAFHDTWLDDIYSDLGCSPTKVSSPRKQRSPASLARDRELQERYCASDAHLWLGPGLKEIKYYPHAREQEEALSPVLHPQPAPAQVSKGPSVSHNERKCDCFPGEFCHWRPYKGKKYLPPKPEEVIPETASSDPPSRSSSSSSLSSLADTVLEKCKLKRKPSPPPADGPQSRPKPKRVLDPEYVVHGCRIDNHRLLYLYKEKTDPRLRTKEGTATSSGSASPLSAGQSPVRSPSSSSSESKEDADVAPREGETPEVEEGSQAVDTTTEVRSKGRRVMFSLDGSVKEGPGR